MQKYTEDELKDMHAQSIPWLRQLAGYTGSFVGTGAKGDPVLVAQFETVTPEIQKAVAQNWQGYPFEVRAFPMARAYRQ